ncbi:MAG: hypothetical protein U0746_15525 [Gemmataceae bacterium]
MIRRSVGMAVVALVGAVALWRGMAPKPVQAAPPRPAMSPEEWRYFQSQAPHWRAFAIKR